MHFQLICYLTIYLLGYGMPSCTDTVFVDIMYKMKMAENDIFKYILSFFVSDRTDNIDDHGGRVKEEASVSVDGQGPILFSVWVSFIEIYNEQIFDLLDPPPKKKTERRQVRQLREDKNGTPYIKGMF